MKHIVYVSIVLLVALFLLFAGCQTSESERTSAPPTTQLPVLAYHLILGAQWYYPLYTENPWVMSEDAFASQMQYLYDNNYTTINATQLFDFLYHGYDLPPNAVLITFDDGYLGTAVYAAPVMREFGFTGIVFVITNDLADEPGEVSSNPSQIMSLVDMYATMDVFEFGSHTHDMHRFVDGAPQLLSASIEEIRRDLQQSFRHPFLSIQAGFSYPFGQHGEEAVQALQAEQIPFAFATHWEYVRRETDPLRLPRFSVTSGCSLEWFSEVVSGRWERQTD